MIQCICVLKDACLGWPLLGSRSNRYARVRQEEPGEYLTVAIAVVVAITKALARRFDNRLMITRSATSCSSSSGSFSTVCSSRISKRLHFVQFQRSRELPNMRGRPEGGSNIGKQQVFLTCMTVVSLLIRWQLEQPIICCCVVLRLKLLFAMREKIRLIFLC